MWRIKTTARGRFSTTGKLSRKLPSVQSLLKDYQAHRFPCRSYSLRGLTERRISMKATQAPAGRKTWSIVLVIAVLSCIGLPITRLRTVQGINWTLKQLGFETQISPETVYISESHAKFSTNKNSGLRDVDESVGEGFSKLPEFQYESKKKRKR